MDQNHNNFELNFKESKIQVQRHSIGTQTIFRIIFPDKRQPLVLTRATHSEAHHFWTSIPEGRQKEAEEIGPLIAAYLQ